VAEPLDRDRQIEQLLRQPPAERPAAVSACIEAEQLAAWSSGSLRSDESATVERHLADCANCQAMLAAFVESEPVPARAVAPFWRRWSVRWLVPRESDDDEELAIVDLQVDILQRVHVTGVGDRRLLESDHGSPIG
jgi:hypothetical protein